jgi:hypothetical protein
MDPQRLVAGARGEGDRRRRQPCPRTQDLDRLREIVARPAGSRSRPDGRVDEDRLGERSGRHSATLARRRAVGRRRRRELDLDDRVPAGWHRRAGRDPDRGAAFDGGLGRRPGPDLSDNTEQHRRRVCRGRDVGRPDRVAVHRGVVPRRQGREAHNVLGEHPAACLGQEGVLCFGRAVDRGEDGVAGLLDA